MVWALDIVARVTRLRRRPSVADTSDAEAVNRILVVEPKNIGDVILAIPFLAQLRARFPTAKTTLLAAPHAQTILKGTGLVDDFIETRLDWTEKSTRYNPLGYNWRELWRLKRELRSHDFDLAFNCSMQIREQVVMGLSGARRRIGYAIGGRDGLLTDAIAVENADRHKVDDWLLLLQRFGGAKKIAVPRLRVSGEERRWADEYLGIRGISTKDTVIGIHPGASAPEKRWPLERFAEIGRALAQRSGVRILVFVDPAGYGESLAEIEGAVTAQVGLRELVALIERCDVLVCNDSGPMHIAGALDVPTVAMFGSGIERWFAPLGEGHEALTSNSDEVLPTSHPGREGIRPPAGITSSQVLEALDRTLQRRRGDGTLSRV
jgi:lipopolysaccharide heptosyltransferase II